MPRAVHVGIATLALVGSFLEVLLASPPAWSEPLRFGPRDTALFTISKSENRNQVQFAVRLDAQCMPEGNAPVYAYWRMLEHGPSAVEPLLGHEQPAYGIRSQAVERAANGGAVRIALRALPTREIVVRTWRTDAGCTARAETVISGGVAQLANVHAKLRWPFGIDRLFLSGTVIADGRAVREVIEP